MDEAACQGMDPNLFHPYPGEQGEARQAKAVCERCPVREACLDYALATWQRFGIWGGLTDGQRRHLRRKRNAA